MAWLKLIGPVLKFLSWLGTILLVRKGAKDEVRADVAEETVETIDRVAAPIGDDERERLWRENAAKYRRSVRDDSGA